MRLLYAAALLPLLAACTVERQTTVTRVVSSVTPEQRQACVSAAAQARGVPEAAVTQLSASASTAGPVVTMNVDGVSATCQMDDAGDVTRVTFGAAG